MRVDGGRVRCRNAKGKVLGAVPAALKDDAQVVRLRQLVEWLDRHDAECLSTVDTWLARSLPVPTVLVGQVWADSAWRSVVRDLVVDAGEVGFLRDADPERGVGLVTLDGDTVWVRPETITVPHPVLLDDLDELREFAAELGVEQRVQQLFRQTFARPDALPATGTVSDFSGARFEQINHVLARCRTLGYPVRGGEAVYPVFEGGATLQARFWVGADQYPESEAWTGELWWTRPDGTTVPLAEVGPVAWSEGTRMASAIHAGRAVEEGAE
ncbi:hypothetical protein Aglo01_29020 [Actinokineospora globicatena]|nr:hypothetical protein Aglo01_29020 [Actinokineospora globicatena]GLW84916.1 hypothetical protein Aglo02_25560 [Actinokineospora globicatena]